MSGTAVTDEGLETIGELPSLKKLSLNSTVVTTDGVTMLSNLRQLEELDLSFTQAGDDCNDRIGYNQNFAHGVSRRYFPYLPWVLLHWQRGLHWPHFLSVWLMVMHCLSRYLHRAR